jgi:hypothetical protein
MLNTEGPISENTKNYNCRLCQQLSKINFDNNIIISDEHKAHECLIRCYVLVNKKLPYDFCRNNIKMGETLNDKEIFDYYLRNQFEKVKKSDNSFINAAKRLNKLMIIQKVHDYSSLSIKNHFHPEVNLNEIIHSNNSNNTIIGNNIDDNTNVAGISGPLRNIDATIDNEDDNSSLTLRSMLKSVITLRRKKIKAQQTCRKIYISILQKWITARDSGLEEKAYEYLCLFIVIPKIIYNKNISDNKLKHVLLEINKDQFSLRNFIEVCARLEQNNNNANNKFPIINSDIQKTAKVNKLMESGKIAKAFNLLSSDNLNSNVINESTIEKLILLHPQRREPAHFIPTEDQTLQFSDDEIKHTINRLKRDKAPGLSQFTAEMIQDLISNEDNNNDSTQFLFYFTKFINNYADGILPEKFYNLVQNSRLIPINKSSGGIRPIVLVELIDKIAGSAFLSRSNIKDKIGKLLKPFQVGINTSSAIEMVNKLLEVKKFQNPDLDVVALDFKNAFNNISRTTILNELQKSFPEIYNWQIKQLNKSSRLWIKTDDVSENIGFIRSNEGVQQGSSLGPFLFALALNPTLQEMNKIISQDNHHEQKSVVISYLDDTNIISETDKIIKIYDFIKTEGPKVGLLLNPQKTIICVGNHKDNDISAQKWKLKLDLDPLGNYNNIKMPSDPNNYGFMCLGSPWGNKNYIINQLKDLLKNIKKEFDKVLLLEKCQYKWLILFYILQNKINHYQRTIYVENMLSYSEEMNTIILNFVKNLLNTDDELEHYAANKCFLKLNFGGLGLHNQMNKNISACLASFIQSFCYLKCNNYLQDERSIMYMNEQGNKLLDKFFQLVKSPPDITDTFSANLNSLYNFIYKDNSDIINDDSIFINFLNKNKIQSLLSETIRTNDLLVIENSIKDNPERLMKFNSNKSSIFLSRIYKILPIIPFFRIHNAAWIMNTNNILDRDIGKFSHQESNYDNNNEMFFVTCPICNDGNNQRLNDNKGHHQTSCPSSNFKRKIMHDNILKSLMDLIKSAGISALKEPTDVLTKLGNHGDILIPDIFIPNNPLDDNKSNTVYDLFIVHPSNDGLRSSTLKKISKYNQANEITNGTTIFKPIGLDLFGTLDSETFKFIDNIASFGSNSKDKKKSYFLNRFYNNLSFTFAYEFTNIIQNYISKYGEYRIRIPTHIL